MNKYTKIDLSNWRRAKLFEYYQHFDSPNFNVSGKINAKNLYALARSKKESTFLLSLYALLRAVNATPELKQRELNGDIVEFEKIDVIMPVMGSGEVFSQIRSTCEDNFYGFKDRILPVIELAKSGVEMPITENSDDFVCLSCNPWFHFESATMCDYSFHQIAPIIGWGRLQNDMIPVCTKASHSFVDGIHIARFYKRIQNFFSMPEMLF